MSCLFDSMSVLFNNLSINLTSLQIRQKICDYLESNGTLIEGMKTKDILDLENKSYVEHMRLPSTMGGAIEVQAACCIWNLKIYVKTNESEIEFVPVLHNSESELPSLNLGWQAAHYVPIIEKIEKVTSQ